jgi:protein TonB
MGDNKRVLVVPLFISLLLHLLVLLGLSVNFLWPKSVAAKKPVPIRIVSVDQPKPKENLPPNPESRFLSNASRKESGKGKSAAAPRLKRGPEDLIPSRRGEHAPKVASLVPPSPPVPVRPPVPEVREVTPVPKSKPERPKPKKKPKVEKTPDAEKVEAKPEPSPKKPPLPKEMKKARPIPPESKTLKASSVKPKSPRKKTPEPKKKVIKIEKEKPQKRVEVASLPKPRPKPREARKPVRKVVPPKPRAPIDPIAMFRPKPKGRPDAPRFKLSDEDAARITKAAEDERRRLEEEAGDEVSLDTKDYRFVSYFAHIKMRIKENWRWPEEARHFRGRLKLRIVIRPDGSLSRVELTDSSGYKILDDEALSAIAKAAPFNPFPPELKKKPLAIKGSFSYENSPNIFNRRR